MAVRAEITKTENKGTAKKIEKNKSLLLKKTNEIDIPLTRVIIKKEQEGTHK